MLTCDIIIPSYNNAAAVPLTLEAVYEQVIPTGWTVRVIVSDDGSTDATRRAVMSRETTTSAPWQTPLFLSNDHAGVAAARNRALDISQANVVFLLGADIILAPGALTTHLDWHSHHLQDALGALGMVKWDPRVKPTVLMDWMVHGGPQNDFDSLLGLIWADPAHFFYASHLSLKRACIGTHRFSEDFKEYGWEDLDFGRSLKKAVGLRLAVLHEAVGHHYHRYTTAAIRARQCALGQGIVTYQLRHPEAKIMPSTVSKMQILRRSIGRIPLVQGLIWYMVKWAQDRQQSWPWLFQIATSLEFWHGVYSHKKQISTDLSPQNSHLST